MRGTVRYGSPQPVVLATSAVKQAASSGEDIVTTRPRRGANVGEGTVVMTVSGRPVFVLRGAQPSHRDLAPGHSGPDVAQLERALARLGFPPGSSTAATTAGPRPQWRPGTAPKRPRPVRRHRLPARGAARGEGGCGGGSRHLPAEPDRDQAGGHRGHHAGRDRAGSHRLGDGARRGGHCRGRPQDGADQALPDQSLARRTTANEARARQRAPRQPARGRRRRLEAVSGQQRERRPVRRPAPGLAGLPRVDPR